MYQVVISGTGLYTPPNVVTNDELVDAYNEYAQFKNSQIEIGSQNEIPLSSSSFIEKASGIKQRYVMYKDGMLGPNELKPRIPATNIEHEPEVVSMGIEASQEALRNASCEANDIDLVIVAATNIQRAYPSIAIEIQQKLGCKGAAFDLSLACSSATFGMISAHAYIKAGLARKVLVVNPEFVSPQVDLTSRDSHFIFGDVATAIVLERSTESSSANQFEVLNTHQETHFSKNIYCLGNYTDHCISYADNTHERPYFHQEGRKVFKELLPLVTQAIENQLESLALKASDLKRMWLHQANINMNHFAGKKLLGREPTQDEALLFWMNTQIRHLQALSLRSINTIVILKKESSA